MKEAKKCSRTRKCDGHLLLLTTRPIQLRNNTRKLVTVGEKGRGVSLMDIRSDKQILTSADP